MFSNNYSTSSTPAGQRRHWRKRMYIVQPLFVAVDKYDVKALQEECIFYMVSSIRVNNVIDMTIFVHLYSIEELEDEAIEFAVWNSREIAVQDEFADLIENYPDFSVKVMRRLLLNWSFFF